MGKSTRLRFGGGLAANGSSSSISGSGSDAVGGSNAGSRGAGAGATGAEPLVPLGSSYAYPSSTSYTSYAGSFAGRVSLGAGRVGYWYGGGARSTTSPLASPKSASRRVRARSATRMYPPVNIDAPTTDARANARTLTALTMNGMIVVNAPPKEAPAATQHAKPPVTGKRNRSAPVMRRSSRYMDRSRASSSSGPGPAGWARSAPWSWSWSYSPSPRLCG